MVINFKYVVKEIYAISFTHAFCSQSLGSEHKSKCNFNFITFNLVKILFLSKSNNIQKRIKIFHFIMSQYIRIIKLTRKDVFNRIQYLLLVHFNCLKAKYI